MQAEEYMAADIAKKGEHFLMGQAGENGKKSISSSSRWINMRKKNEYT